MWLKKILNPLFPRFERPAKRFMLDDILDDEDYLPLSNHWCEVHPIQREELNSFARELTCALHEEVYDSEKDLSSLDMYKY